MPSQKHPGVRGRGAPWRPHRDAGFVHSDLTSLQLGWNTWAMNWVFSCVFWHHLGGPGIGRSGRGCISWARESRWSGLRWKNLNTNSPPPSLSAGLVSTPKYVHRRPPFRSAPATLQPASLVGGASGSPAAFPVLRPFLALQPVGSF